MTTAASCSHRHRVPQKYRACGRLWRLGLEVVQTGSCNLIRHLNALLFCEQRTHQPDASWTVARKLDCASRTKNMAVTVTRVHLGSDEGSLGKLSVAADCNHALAGFYRRVSAGPPVRLSYTRPRARQKRLGWTYQGCISTMYSNHF